MLGCGGCYLYDLWWGCVLYGTFILAANVRADQSEKSSASRAYHARLRSLSHPLLKMRFKVEAAGALVMNTLMLRQALK